jgi:hypothetical protein
MSEPLGSSSNYEWISLSKGEKTHFIDLAKNCAPQHPTFFNLSVDSQNAPGQFADPNKDQIVQDAISSAKWLLV